MFKPKSATALKNGQYRVNKADFIAIQEQFPNIPIEKESKVNYSLYSIRVDREVFTLFSEEANDIDIDEIMNEKYKDQKILAAPFVPTKTFDEDMHTVAVQKKADELKISDDARATL